MSETREMAPSRFADYLAEVKEYGAVLHWVWRDLTGAAARRMLKWMVAMELCMYLFLALQPYAFAVLINGATHHAPRAALLGGVSLILTAILQQVFSLALGLVREWAINRSMFSLQDRVNELYCEKTLGQHLGEGAQLNHTSIDRAKGRVEMVQGMLIFDTSPLFITLLFCYLLVWTLNWQIGIAATFLIGMHILWSLVLNYHAVRDTDGVEKEMRAHGRQLIERWEKLARVKTSGKTRSEHERLSRWYDQILLQDWQCWSRFIRHVQLRNAVALLVRVVVVGYGTYLVYRGSWQVGLLVPLYSWMADIAHSLDHIGHAERRMNQQLPYIKRLRVALTTAPAFVEGEGELLTTMAPVEIRFDHIGLSYDEGARRCEILRDVSFTIRPGEKVALLGESGAGKTSLMKLLLRYTDPTSGAIYVDGKPLTSLQLESWMQHVGYIPQQAEVFDGTIRYNLTFGLSEERARTITDDEIWEVMRLLKIDFAGRLVDGLATRVGKDGMKLSGGQAQRLMIGAAVLKQPHFMVIDEATSSLDSSTEKEVQRGLRQVLSGPVGALIVTHRLSTVRHVCDRFIVLRPLSEVLEGESQIEAVADSFEELHRISPTFCQLAADQELAP